MARKPKSRKNPLDTKAGPPYVHWTAFPPGFIEPFYPGYRSDGYFAIGNPKAKKNNRPGPFLKPATKGWPVGDLKHAKLALQYMAMGRGDPREYPMLLAKLQTIWIPGSARAKPVWDYYEQVKHQIRNKSGAQSRATRVVKKPKKSPRLTYVHINGRKGRKNPLDSTVMAKLKLTKTAAKSQIMGMGKNQLYEVVMFFPEPYASAAKEELARRETSPKRQAKKAAKKPQALEPWEMDAADYEAAMTAAQEEAEHGFAEELGPFKTSHIKWNPRKGKTKKNFGSGYGRKMKRKKVVNHAKTRRKVKARASKKQKPKMDARRYR